MKHETGGTRMSRWSSIMLPFESLALEEETYKEYRLYDAFNDLPFQLVRKWIIHFLRSLPKSDTSAESQNNLMNMLTLILPVTAGFNSHQLLNRMETNHIKAISKSPNIHLAHLNEWNCRFLTPKHYITVQTYPDFHYLVIMREWDLRVTQSPVFYPNKSVNWHVENITLTAPFPWWWQRNIHQKRLPVQPLKWFHWAALSCWQWASHLILHDSMYYQVNNSR